MPTRSWPSQNHIGLQSHFRLFEEPMGLSQSGAEANAVLVQEYDPMLNTFSKGSANNPQIPQGKAERLLGVLACSETRSARCKAANCNESMTVEWMRGRSVEESACDVITSSSSRTVPPSTIDIPASSYSTNSPENTTIVV